MGEKVLIIGKNTDASKEFVVDVNACKAKYMIMYLHQNAGCI
jgi:hypothetical protein